MRSRKIYIQPITIETDGKEEEKKEKEKKAITSYCDT
jgi:hypothetical protein